MQRIALLALCALTAACHHSPTEGGIQANVHVDADTHVTCIQLAALDTAGNVLGTTSAPVNGKEQLPFAITQGSYPADISLHVVGLYSASGCDEPALPNAQPADLTGLHFKAGVAVVDLTIHKPTSADDSDSDGFTSSAKGGPDCDDANPVANPGATERCGEIVDLNCNARYGCDDPTCAGKTCLSPPASVAFGSAPQSAASQICSSAIVVELRDTHGVAVPVGANTPVSLAEMGNLGVAIYSDSGCTVAAMTADIPKGQRQVRFYAKGGLAGTTQLQATAAGLSSAQQAFVVAPGAATAVYFTTAPQTVKADRCSTAVNIEARDLQMNPAPVASDLAFTVTPNPSTGISLYADATCMTALGAAKIAAGTSSATFYFKAERTPGTVTLGVAAPPLSGAMQVETVDPGDPAAFKFTTSPQTVGAGLCSGAMTVQLVDAHGVNTTPASGMGVSLTGPSFTFFTDAACATAANGSAMFSPTTGAATVFFRATTAGMSMVTATGGGLTNATQTQTIVAGPPSQLVFQNGVGGVPQSTCAGPVQLAVRDQYGNTATVTGVPLPITLSASPATGFTFYQAGACSTPVTTVSIPANQSSVSFNFMGTMAGQVTLTAMSALTSPTANLTIGVGPAAKLVFTTAPQTRKANACSGAVTLQAQDTGSNVVGLTSPLTITLQASPATGFTFYSDSACSSVAVPPQVVMPMGASQVTYYFKGTAAGPVTMSPMSSLTDPTQVATLTPESATALAFTNAPLTVTAGACSAALTLQSRDAYGNPSAVAADTVLMLSAMPSSNITFFSNAGCSTAVSAVTLSTAGPTVQFYVQANTVPSYALQAQAQVGSLGMVGQALTVNPANASQLVILTSQQMRNTGQCSSAVTVQRQDPYGNPVTSGTTNVSLSQTPAGGGLQFYSTMGCSTSTTSSVSIGSGSSTTNAFFSGTLPGMPTLVISSGTLAQATQLETINVSPPSKLVFTSAPQLNVAAGSCSAVVAVQSQDAFSNVSSVLMDTPLTLGAPPANGGFYNDPSCTSPVSSPKIAVGGTGFTWYFKGTTALPFMLSVNATGLTGATQSAAIVAGALNQLIITTPMRSASTGACSQVLTVQRQDQYGNPVTSGALPVMLAASPSTNFTFFRNAGCGMSTTSVTIADTASTADFYFSGTTPGPVQVTASAGGSVSSAMQQETVSTGSPSKVVFTTPMRTTTAGACSAVLTLQAQDSFNNPAPAGAGGIMITLSATGGNPTFYSDSNCTMASSNPNIGVGMTNRDFYATGTIATGSTITANAGGLGSPTQAFSVSAAAASKFVFTTLPQSIVAGACSSVATVQSQDMYNNVSGVASPTTLTPSVAAPGAVMFFSDACTTPVGAGVMMTTGQTTGSFYMRAGSTPQATSITVNSSPALTAPSQMVTVTVGSATKLKITSAAPSLMAGECSGMLTVQQQDMAGNPVTRLVVTTVGLSASALGSFKFYSDSNCTNGVSSVSISIASTAAAFWVKGTTGGSTTMTASDMAATLTSDTQMATIQNAVQTGTCLIASGNASVSCPVSPALRDVTKSFMVFQAANLGVGPSNSQIRCELTDTAHITCSRAGNAGVDVRWYTVSLPSGLKVQHINGLAAAGTSQLVTVMPAVNNVNDSFLLLSTDFAGTTFNNQALTTARLNATSQVTLTRLAAPGPVMTHSIQVVEWTGAVVVHGAASITNGNTLATAGGLADTTTSPTFLLSTSRWGVASTNEICRQSIQASIVDTTTVAFSRGSGVTGGCNDEQIDIEFERVQLPTGHRVDGLFSMPVGPVAGATLPLVSPVDLTRSLAFFSNQGIAGQASGQCVDATLDRPRDCLMTAAFVDASNVSTTRVTPSTDAGFSLFVLQVSP